MLREAFAKIRALPGTRVLHRYVPPLSTGRFGHGMAPPAQVIDEPVITARRLGRGQVIYVAHPFFKAYHDHQNPQQARLLLQLLDRVLPDPVARIDTPAQVELCTMRKGNDLILHLVNHSGRERLGNYWYPVTEYIPEIRDIALTIRGQVREARLQPAGEALKLQTDSAFSRTTIPSLQVMQTIAVPRYFT
jgi:hypothetical protein